MAVKTVGSTSNNIAEVDASNNLFVKTPGLNGAGVSIGGGTINAPALISEADGGLATGVRKVREVEADFDYRLRVGIDNILDDETFNYTAQNTGKFTLTATTMAALFEVAGLRLNTGNITTLNTGVTISTYSYFPFFNSGVPSYLQFEFALSNTPVIGQVIDIGLFLRPTSHPYAPTDGVYLRVDSAGLKGVINAGGTEQEVIFAQPAIAINQVYKGTISFSNKEVNFWLEDIIQASIQIPNSQAQPFLSTALPFSVRQVNLTAPSTPIQLVLKSYGVSIGGPILTRTLSQMGNSIFGAYQGLSGGVMGSLANYANNTNPTAVLPTNTTAAAGSLGLGGQFWETDTLAVATDGIIMSYQVPAGTTAVIGKRLVITGVKIDSFVQTTLVGGGYNAQFVLNFGHTTVSLGTVEAIAAKAPRRLLLGAYSVGVAAVALTQFPTISLDLSQSPVYVNPGEFVAISKKKIGTAPSAGVIAHSIVLTYGWE